MSVERASTHHPTTREQPHLLSWTTTRLNTFPPKLSVLVTESTHSSPVGAQHFSIVPELWSFAKGQGKEGELCNFAKGFQPDEASTYQVLSTSESQCQPRPGSAADCKAAARSWGRARSTPLGAHSVPTASTSATNLMCDLENVTLQIPFGL